WVPTILFLALMATCNEQVPFIYLGLGLYAMYALRDQKPRNWVVGGAICLAALVLWRFEMKVINHYQALEPEFSSIAENKWKMFQHLVPAGTPGRLVASEIAAHPFRTLATMFSSIYTFFPLLRVLFYAGFFCLLAPMQMIPFALAFFPHVLAMPPEHANF